MSDDIVVCSDCEEYVVCYSDGSNHNNVNEFILKHRKHNVFKPYNVSF